jgi:hypothetical protein
LIDHYSFAPAKAMSVHPEGVVRALFDEGEGVDTNNIPSQHICPLKQEPPVIGVYFDIPNSDGTLSEQVFERSEIYRWIATLGNSRAHRNVSHPINQQFIFRPEAWSLVRRVSSELQVLLHRERVAMGLLPYDENPLTAEDTDLYNEAMRTANDRR